MALIEKVLKKNPFYEVFRSIAAQQKLFHFFLSIFFFSTGFAALTYQVSWNSIYRQTFGMDYYSNTLVVSIFMLGLGLGGYLGALISSKAKNYILFFFVAEFFISLFGYNSNDIIRWVSVVGVDLSGGSIGTQSLIVDFFLNFALLIWPTILMGASLPIITHFYRNTLKPGATTGLFYSINIFGAMVGAFISGTLLLGHLGISQTLKVISLYNGIFSLLLFVVFMLFRVTAPTGNKNAMQVNPLIPASIGGKGQFRGKIYIASFVIGFIAIGAEMAFFRLGTTYISNISYGFSLILTIYLIHMALGTALAGWGIKKNVDNKSLFFICVAGFVISWVLYFQVPSLLEIFGRIPEDFILGSSSSWRSLIMSFQILFPTMTPVIFISGIFPILVNIITKEPATLGKNVGYLYLIQTYGNFFGAVISSFILFPLIGVIDTIKLFSILFIGVYLFLFVVKKGGTKRTRSSIYLHNNSDNNWKYVLTLAIALGLLIILANNEYFYNFTYYTHAPQRIKETREGIILSYDYEEQEKNSFPVKLSRINLSGSGVTGYFHKDQDYPVWPNDAFLALMENPPKRALIIGVGSGLEVIVLKSLFPDVEIVVVELLESVLDELKELASPLTIQSLNGSKLIVGDGHRYLNRLKVSPDNKFDLIQLGIFHVTAPGAGGLFTRETLETLKGLITPKGIVTFNAYIPAVKAGMGVFESVYVLSNGDKKIANVALMETPQMSLEEFKARYVKSSDFIKERIHSLKLEGVINPHPPKGGFVILNRENLKKTLEGFPEQTDDLPATEFFFSQKTSFGVLYYDSRQWPKEAADYFIDEQLPRSLSENSLIPAKKLR